MWAKLLDLALLILPVVFEWFKKRREEGQTAAEYVRRQQEERLKTYDAMLKGSNELTKLSRARVLVARELLRRVRKVPEPASGEPGVFPTGPELPENGERDVPVPDAAGRKD